MYMMAFRYEVDPEKQEEYLKATREKIKPYWLSHGSWAYDVYQLYDSEKGKLGTKFLKLQVGEGEPALKGAEAPLAGEAKAVVDLFYSLTKNVMMETYIKKAA